MPVSLKKVMEKFPRQRQERIQKEANLLIEEYKNLQEFRKSIGLTQKELADKLGVNQVNISQLESREDMHVSTLRKYVEALGGQLEINIRMPGESEMSLNS